MFGTTLALAPLLLIGGDTESAAVERAVLDYAEAYYEVRPDYVERGIHPELVKAGYLLAEDGSLEVHPMNFEGFMGMVEWFAKNDSVPDPGPKDVVVLDVLDQTAICRLTGSWGIDYMQLAKFDGRWQTKHVIWQRLPREQSEEAAAADRRAIERAVLDYVEGIYEVKPDWVERSVDPGLAKIGFGRDSAGAYHAYPMTFEELVDLAGSYNLDGTHTGVKTVEVLDQLDHTACAKLTASWGIDYMNLVKVDGTWRIMQVLWQSAPPAAPGQG